MVNGQEQQDLDRIVLENADRETFSGLADGLMELENHDAFGLLQAEALETSVAIFSRHRSTTDGSITITEEIATEYADRLWDRITENISKRYLGLSDSAVSELKEAVDPATGRGFYDTFMQSFTGLDRNVIYEEVKGDGSRGERKMKGLNIPEIAALAYNGPVRAAKTRKMQESTQDIESLHKMNLYLKEEQDRGNLQGVELPTDPRDVLAIYNAFLNYSAQRYMRKQGQEQQRAA